MTAVALTELSPEVVLVSPDLQEAVRSALPERPWEAFLPRPLPEQEPLAARQRRSLVERVVEVVPALFLFALVVVLVVGSLPWVGEHPTIEQSRPDAAATHAAAGAVSVRTP